MTWPSWHPTKYRLLDGRPPTMPALCGHCSTICSWGTYRGFTCRKRDPIFTTRQVMETLDMQGKRLCCAKLQSAREEVLTLPIPRTRGTSSSTPCCAGGLEASVPPRRENMAFKLQARHGSVSALINYQQEFLQYTSVLLCNAEVDYV